MCNCVRMPNIDALNRTIANVITKNRHTARKLFVSKFSDNYLQNTFNHGARVGGRIEYVRLFSHGRCLHCTVDRLHQFHEPEHGQSIQQDEGSRDHKVVGAVKGVLIWQFIGESLLLTLLAVLVALILAIALLPAFNYMTGKEIIMPVNHV